MKLIRKRVQWHPKSSGCNTLMSLSQILAAHMTKMCTSHDHYDGVIMGVMASQITSLTIVYSSVFSGADQRKHQSSASLAFVRGIHRGPVNSPYKWPVTRKMFPFDDVIVITQYMYITLTGIGPASWLWNVPVTCNFGRQIDSYVGSLTGVVWSLASWHAIIPPPVECYGVSLRVCMGVMTLSRHLPHDKQVIS